MRGGLALCSTIDRFAYATLIPLAQHARPSTNPLPSHDVKSQPLTRPTGLLSPDHGACRDHSEDQLGGHVAGRVKLIRRARRPDFVGRFHF